MLEVNDLHVEVEGKKILNGLTLKIGAGEVHAIMGVNGSGKSTLASVIAGKDGYEITNGTIFFEGKDLLEMEAEERAHLGLFLAFQYPVELPGVVSSYFLRTAFNSTREARGESPLSVVEFSKYLKERVSFVEMDEDLLKRAVNDGFSGGEKKRNEILQMAVLDPKFCILDETDSGLDIDALQIVARGVNKLRSPNKSFLVITHYQRLLNYIIPDFVHVMIDGKIVKSGGKELALELEEKGYNWVRENVAQ